MADDKDKKDEKDDNKGELEHKYRTLDEYAKGYSALEKKLGEQGKALGDLKKQIEGSTQTLQKYESWAKEAVPIVEWYSKFQQPIQQWWGQFQNTGTTGQGQQTGNVGAAAYQQAAQQVSMTPGVELLTQQEKAVLVNDTAQRLIQQTLAPWTQQFAQTVEAWGNNRSKEISSQMDQRHKAFSDVLWKTLERVIPADKLEETRAWHDEALKYADPKNIDPLSLASETLSLRNDKARMESQIKELTAAREKADAAAMGSMGQGGGLYRKQSDLKEMPTSREDRMKNVMSTVKDAVGVDGLREQFPAL
jgi:hypothetical protein